MNHDPQRPAYVSPSWFRCNQGMALAGVAPDELRDDATLQSANLWERVVCVFLQAQSGDFRNAGALLETVRLARDAHLRDCAIDLFGFCAPFALLEGLAKVFEHPYRDTRLEAYTAASLSGHLGLAALLARRRRHVDAREKERVMDALSELIEPAVEDLIIVDNRLPDDEFEALVDEMIAKIRAEHGDGMCIRHAAPIDAPAIVSNVIEMCSDEDPEQWGGAIASALSLLEAMTGFPYAGCLDQQCTPVLPKISHLLNTLHQRGGLRKLVPGARYFFGHAIDRPG